jgi:hypothetical protein
MMRGRKSFSMMVSLFLVTWSLIACGRDKPADTLATFPPTKPAGEPTAVTATPAPEACWVGTFTYCRSINWEHSSSTALQDETVKWTERCGVNVQAVIPLTLKVSEDALVPDPRHFQQYNITGPCSISWEKETTEEHALKDSSYTIVRTEQANCGGHIFPDHTRAAPNEASLWVDEDNQTFSLSISFASAEGCAGIWTVEGSDGTETGPWEVEPFVFSTGRLVEQYAENPLKGRTDGRTIHGSWTSPAAVDEAWCGIEGNHIGVSVEWSLSKKEGAACQGEEKPPCDQIETLKKYIEFDEKRRDYYKKYGDEAENPDDLDRLVKEAMEREYQEAEGAGEIQTEGGQREGGHYDPCTDDLVVHDVCGLVGEQPLCEWLTTGFNKHEHTHRADAIADPTKMSVYCKRYDTREAAKIAADWEYNAYNEEIKLYKEMLESLKNQWPECFE